MKTILTFFFLFFPILAFSQELPQTYPSHYFAFSETDSISYPAIYPDQTTRDSISDDYSNFHERAKAIEDYALKEQNVHFLQRLEEKENKWSLKLTSGKEIKIGPRPRSNVIDYNFEHYYPSIEILVFRAQWNEGNNYVLISRKDGTKTEMYGPPIFSPSKELFISYNGVEFNSYNKNGIQLFKLSRNGIKKLIEYDTKLSPSRIKWINDNTFSLEMYNARLIQSKGMVRNYQHYKVAIKETEF